MASNSHSNYDIVSGFSVFRGFLDSVFANLGQSRMQYRSSAIVAFVFFAFLVFGFAIFDLSYGFHPTDDGFILGYAWRILNGEKPYVDFIYVRPPGTPLFWASVLSVVPDSMQFKFARFGFFVQLGIFSCLFVLLVVLWELRGAASVKSRVISRSDTLNFILLSSFGFLFALYDFPPMPWHTVDGVMFGTLAVALLNLSFTIERFSRFRFILNFASGAFAAYAALSKQNFLVIPIFCFCSMLLTVFYRRRSFTELAGFLLGCCLPLILILEFIGFSGLKEGLRQINSASDPGYLIDVGLVRFSPFRVWNLGAIILSFVSVYPVRIPFWRVQFFQSLIPAILLGLCGVWIIKDKDAVSFFLFWYFLGYFLFGLLWDRTGWLARQIRLGYFLVAWASSISWACIFPLLGLPAIVSAALIAPSVVSPPVSIGLRRSRLLVTGLSFCAVCYVVLNNHFYLPYRDVARPNQSVNLKEILPKIGSVFTNVGTGDKVRDLMSAFRLADGFGLRRNRVVVIPDFPAWYFLNDVRNPVSIDWWLPQEFPGLSDRLKSEIDRKAEAIVLEKLDPNEDCSSAGRRSEWIDTVWSFNGSTVWYCIFSKVALRVIK